MLPRLLFALAATGPLLFGSPSLAQQTSPALSNSKIVIYEQEKGDRGYWKTGFGKGAKPISPEHAALRERMMKRRVLEQFAEFLSPLRLPYTLFIIASDCDGKAWDSPYYSPYNHLINMCYSFIAAAERNAETLVAMQESRKLWTPVSKEQLMAGLFASVLLHETGHAMFDLLNVPVFGREEDAADFMAAFIGLQFGRETARTVVKGFAYYWAYDAEQGADPAVNKPANPAKDPEIRCMQDPFCAYSDEHGTASQRMYNTLCMAYGGDPEGFKDFVDIGWLPKERAEGCASEYQRLKFAFERTILPFIDQQQMKNVRARSWFMPSETRER
jgi:hypothetical protein